MTPLAWLRQKAEDVTSGMDTFPLVMLTTLFFFDEFDTAAFNVLAPNIRNAFGLSFTEFGLLVVANLTIVLLAAVPMGHYGDRLPRRKFVVAGAILAGICSFFTGLVSVLGLLVIVRLGNGIGRLVNDPIHSSLLADYYKPEDRPRVFGFHRNAVYIGTIVGSALAGLMTWLFGTYKAAFLVLIVPIVAAALYATRLKEPVRGATDDPEAAESAEKEDPVPFAEASRTLFAVKTLRRQFAAWLFIGAGLVPLAWLLPLTLERVFHLGALERGLIGAVNAAATFAGIQLSSKRTIKWLAEGMGEPLKRAGVALSLVGVGIAILAFLPLGMFVPVGIATSFVAGIFFPPFYTTQAFVSPARVRSLSYSFGALFIVAGVWLLYFLPGISAIADNDGMRWGLFATFPFWIIGGLILRSGHRFVADDTQRAMATLALVADMRRARREAGDEALLICRGVAVAYDQVQVLFGVDMEVAPGEIVALLGTNGAGKSTMLKAISGVLDPIGGAMFFGGRDITHADANQTAKLGIVQVPGGRAVFPTLTVA